MIYKRGDIGQFSSAKINTIILSYLLHRMAVRINLGQVNYREQYQWYFFLRDGPALKSKLYLL